MRSFWDNFLGTCGSVLGALVAFLVGLALFVLMVVGGLHWVGRGVQEREPPGQQRERPNPTDPSPPGPGVAPRPNPPAEVHLQREAEEKRIRAEKEREEREERERRLARERAERERQLRAQEAAAEPILKVALELEGRGFPREARRRYQEVV